VVAHGVSSDLAAAVDWSAPWFGPVAADGRAMVAAPDLRGALSETARRRNVRTAAGPPLRFAGPAAAGSTAYEAHIARTGEVPTRDNLHDFLNALVWLAFPRTKARLNALQANAIAAHGIGVRRGPVRDAATLIDENGMLLVTRRADLIDALRQRAWRQLFVAHRAAWAREVRPVVFGHALMEKLTAPYKGITAHALPVLLPPDAPLAAIDAGAAAALDATLSPRRLLPVPVMGIPGWACNDDAAYYDDQAVFRKPHPSGRGLAQPAAGQLSQGQ
jgi:Protein of unknown function (DUF3025)